MCSILEDVCIYNTNVWTLSGTPTYKEWVGPASSVFARNVARTGP